MDLLLNAQIFILSTPPAQKGVGTLCILFAHLVLARVGPKGGEKGGSSLRKWGRYSVHRFCSRMSGAEGGAKGWEGECTFPCLPRKRDLSSFVHVSCSRASEGWGERGSEEGTFMCPGSGRTGWRHRVPLARPVLARVLRGGGRGGKCGLTHPQPPQGLLHPHAP